MADFKYVIQTELELSPSAVSKLLEQVSGLDQQIQGKMKDRNLQIGLRLNDNTISSMQKQIGAIKANIPVRLHLDKNSVSTLKRDIDLVVQNAVKEIEVAITPNRNSEPSMPRNTASRGTFSTGEGRLPVRGGVLRDLAGAGDGIVKAYRAETTRMNAETKRMDSFAKESERANREYINARKKSIAELNEDVALERKAAAQLRTQGVTERNQFNKLLYRDRLQRMSENNLESVLKNPSKSEKEKQDALDKLHKMNAQQSITYGKASRSYQVVSKNANGETGSTRTETFTYEGGQKYNKEQYKNKQLQMSDRYLEDILTNPDKSNKEKQDALARLHQINAEQSKSFGRHSKSYPIVSKNANGEQAATRTQTFTYEDGKAFDKTNQSFNGMMENMTKHFAFKIGIVEAFVQIHKAVIDSVKAMKDFESEFVVVQNLITARNNSESTLNQLSQKTGLPKESLKFDENQAKDDIFSLGKRYGYNPNRDILPVYSEMISRKDIAPTQKDAKYLTQLVVRAVSNAHGNQATPEEFMSTSKDMENILQTMVPYWNKNKLNPIHETTAFVDRLAMTKGQGGDIDKTLKALSHDMLSFVTEGNTGLSLDFMTQFVASAQKYTGADEGGAQLAAASKALITNLSKNKGHGPEEVNRILGLQYGANANPNATVKEKLDLIFKRFDENSNNTQLADAVFDPNSAYLTEGEKQALSQASASNNGSGGSARAPFNMQAFKALGEAYRETQLKPKAGSAEEYAKTTSDTLTGQLGKLTASFQEMSVAVGESGLMNTLKSLTKVITGIVNATTSVMSFFEHVHNAIFGLRKDLGETAKAFQDTIATIIYTGLAIKGVSAFKGALFKENVPIGSPIAQGASVAGQALIGGLPLSSTTATTGAATTGSKFAQARAEASAMWWTKGAGATSNILSLIGLGGLAKGASAGAGAVAGAGSIGTVGKIGSIFANLVGPMSGFLLLLGRLTFWGAIIGAAIAGVTKLVDFVNKKNNDKAIALTEKLTTDPNERSYIADTFAKMSDIKGEQAKQFGTGAKGWVQNLFHPEKQREFNKLQEEMKKHGLDPSFFGDGLSLTTTSPTGDKETNQFKYGNKGSAEIKAQMDALKNGTTVQEELYKGSHPMSLINQYELMGEIQKLQTSSEDRATYNQLGNSLNDIKFAGAKDSTSYLKNGMNVASNTFGGLGKQYEDLAGQRDKLAKQTLQNNLNVTTDGNALDATTRKSIETDFQASKTNGQTASFLNKYVVKDDGTKSQDELEAVKRKYSFAQSLFNQNADIENTKKLEEAHKQLVQSLTQEIAKYKELYVQYGLAASGMHILEATMKGLNTDLSGAKLESILAVGNDSKIQSAAKQFGVMAKQANVYSLELSGVKAKINDISSSNPNENFSLSALYNPNEKGLSLAQEEMKAQIEKQHEIAQNHNSAVEALRQQADTMVDLVMNTEKYKSIWESVNSRIELSKTLYGQIRDIQTQASIQPAMSSVRQSLFGQAFDSGSFAKQGADSRRDSYLNAFEQVSKAISTYGDDATKLNGAIAQIQGDLGKQLKDSFIDPLKDLVANGLTNASNTQLKAANEFNASVETLNKILDADYKRISELAGTNNNTSPTTWSSPTVTWTAPTDGNGNGVSGPPVPKNTATPVSSTMPSLNIMKSPLVQAANAQAQANKPAEKAPDNSTGNIDKIIAEASQKFGVNANIIKSVAKIESSYGKDTSTSSAGAKGIMQLMPGTAKEMGVTDIHDPYQNIMGGTKYLAKLMNQFGGDVEKALIGYNAGPGNVNNVLNSTNPNEWKDPKDYIQKYHKYMTQLDANYVPASTAQVNNKAVDQQKQNDEAQAKLLAQQYQEKLFNGAVTEQVKSLSANNIQFAFDKAARESGIKSSISGIWTDQQTGYYDASNAARSSVANSQFENDATLQAFRNQLASNQYVGADGNAHELTQAMVTTLQNSISALEENKKSLDNLSQIYAKTSYSDPRNNTVESQKQIDNIENRLDALRGTDQVGGLEWSNLMKSLNSVDANYASHKKDQAEEQTAFDNHGENYDHLAKLKSVNYDHNALLLYKQMVGVAGALDTIREGTNQWHQILEDVVVAQQKVVDLENKKTETSKKYFELTNKGLYPYINARAFQQSRDYSIQNANLKSSKDNYANNSNTLDVNEQLVNFQVITETHDKMITVMNEYRTAIVGAFKAGVMSLTEYLQKLNGLRDMQNEIKQQAVDMATNIQGTFQNALSGALKNGLQGSFEAPLDFIQNMKDGLASSISGQMSNIILQQSGLQDVMNNVVSGITDSLTTGDSNKSINSFNTVDYKKMIDGALNPFLPLIQQITESTKGIFGVLKDQTYNAPTGFKIDKYLYDFQKEYKASDLANWKTATPVNEAGSPYPLKNGTDIKLPEMTNKPVGQTGVPTYVTHTKDDVLNQYGNSLNTPIVKTTWNPVKELIKGIRDMQKIYDPTKSPDDPANRVAHNEANALRDTLKSIPGAEDIAKKIGDGITPESMDVPQLELLLKDGNLAQFDMTKGIDGISGGISGMSGLLATKLDGVISGVSSVVNSVVALKTNPEAKNAYPTPPSTPDSLVAQAAIAKRWNTGASYQDRLSHFASNNGDAQSEIVALKNMYTQERANGAQQYRLDEISRWADQVRQVASISNDDPTYGNSSNSPAIPYANNTSSSYGYGVASGSTPVYNAPAGAYGSQGFMDAILKAAGPNGSVNGISPGKFKYHTGGIAGVLNFANGNSLQSNEIQAILRKGEPVFSGGQLGSFIDTLFGGNNAGGSGGDTNINVDVNVNGGSVDEGSIKQAVTEAVQRALYEVGRQGRLNNLQVKGVSY